MNAEFSLYSASYDHIKVGNFYSTPHHVQAIFRGESIQIPPYLVTQAPSSWIYTVSNLVQSGWIQLGVTLFSVLFTTLAVLRTSRPQHQPWTGGRQSIKGSAIRLPFELCSQITRGATSALLIIAARRGHTHWANAAAVSYVFVLGLLRLVNNLEWRHIALHQINFVSVIALLLVTAGHWLPCVRYEVQCSFRGEVAASTVVLGLSLFVAFATPREWIPPSPEQYDVPESRRQAFFERGPAPEETCSWLEYFWTYEWLTPTIWRGAKNDLPKEALPNVPWYDDPMIMLARVRKARAWGKTTIWTSLHLCRVELALMSTWIGTSYVFEVMGPLGMFKLLDHIENPGESTTRPWVWLLAMFFGPAIRSIMFQQYVFTSTRLIVRIKSALTQELYHMALNSMELEHEETKLDEKSQKKQSITTSGRLANLMASDIESIFRARDTIMMAVGIPLGTLANLVLLYNVIGWPSLVGTVILLIAPVMNVMIAKWLMGIQRKARKAQDYRISVVTEYLSQIRAVKYFAWEDAATERIQEARNAEQKQLWRASIFSAMSGVVSEVFPYMALFSVFLLAIFVDDRRLTGSVAFTTVTLIKNIRNKLSRVSWLSRSLSTALVAFGRLDSYFQSACAVEKYPPGPPQIQNGTFRRTPKATFQLKDITVEFVEGGLTAVTGPSGSGKTTLLLALLGETVKESGHVTRPGDVAYASQTAWLQNGTVKENILFTADFEQERYDRVIEACCLGPDLAELPSGDETTIGENGASLSGGQRARVALARALYSKAPMLLLDDIFSALDAKTAAHLWELCFCSQLLKGRTTVLVTQIPWIGSQADLVVELENGLIKSTEQHLGVVRRPISVARILTANSNEGDDTEVDSESDGADKSKAKTKSDPTKRDDIDAEMGNRLAARLSVFSYMKYYGNSFMIFAPVFTMLLAVIFTTGGNLWLAFWTKAYNDHRIVDIGYYLGIYAAIAMAEVIADLGEFIMSRLSAWYAARTLHRELIDGVLRVALSWYQDVPVGRVVNRLSRDVSSLDGMLGDLVLIVMALIFELVFRIGSISSILPVFALPAAAMSVVGIVVGEMYTRTGVILRRLESSSQSPVFTQFTDTLAGLSVIRARNNMPAKFGDILADRLLLWAGTAEALYNANRWVGVRIDFATSLVSLGAGIIALTKSSTIDTGLVGFSLINASGLSGTILSLVRSTNSLEVELQSVSSPHFTIKFIRSKARRLT